MKNCTKCGKSDISVRFKYKGEKVYWNEHKEISGLKKFTRNDTYYAADSIGTECLVYTCNTCKYKIASKTQDNLQ